MNTYKLFRHVKILEEFLLCYFIWNLKNMITCIYIYKKKCSLTFFFYWFFYWPHVSVMYRICHIYTSAWTCIHVYHIMLLCFIYMYVHYWYVIIMYDLASLTSVTAAARSVISSWVSHVRLDSECSVCVWFNKHLIVCLSHSPFSTLWPLRVITLAT